MEMKYFKELNKGTIDIKSINFWQALGLSFFFDWIFMVLNLPTDIFYEILMEFDVPVYNAFWSCLSSIFSFMYQYGALLVIIIFISKRKKVEQCEIKGIKVTRKDYLFASLLIISYISITYGWFDYILFSIPTGDYYDFAMDYFSSLPLWILLFESCIIAPIFEEVLYRGVLLKGLSKRYSTKKAIIYSALIFGIAHLNIPQGINAFLLGIIIGLVYYYTNSIFICIVMHFTNNLLVNFVYYPTTNLWTMILFILVPCIGLALMILSFRAFKLKERYLEIEYIQVDC